MDMFPSPPTPMSASSQSDIDKALVRLQDHKNDWHQLSPLKKAVLLEECITEAQTLTEEWIASSCRAKGILRGSPDEGEEWIGAFMPFVRNLRLLAHTLRKNGQPMLPKTYQRPNGQWVAKVFPFDLKEKLMYMGFDAEVWIKEGHGIEQGSLYKNPPKEGKVCLVLGAGNQGSIGPMDCLYKLFMDGEVCILKMNPVNDYLGPYIVRIFRPLIELNFITVVYGGVEEGKYLCNHKDVESIHITGSDKTFDAIVFGTGEEGIKNKTEGKIQNERPITSELGCVSPILIVPGDWKESELEYQARHIASMVTHNASFNCNAGKIVVFAKEWPLKEKLKERIAFHLQKKGNRKAYYPGAQDRYEKFISRYRTEVCGTVREDEPVIPWTILHDVPAKKDEYALTQEAFCGVIAFTEVDSVGIDEYMDNTLQLCNDDIWGSLSINILISPQSEGFLGKRFDDFIEKLEYGGIAINCWSGVIYGLCTTSWGAFPKHDVTDIQSGSGVVHNTYLLENVQKSVVRAPFVLSPTPAWFYDNKNLVGLGKRLLAFEAKTSTLNFIRLLAQAVRG